MRLVLFGAPGSGKGTQGSYFAARLGVPRLSPGDILRDNQRRGTQLGRVAEGFMERGELVPDEVIVDLISDRLAQPDASGGFILDGFPRTLHQAEALQALLDGRAESIDRVIHLRVSLPTLLERLADRWTCTVCGTVYSSASPRIAGRCDADGSELVQRDDDRPEAVERRIEVYSRETSPVLSFYRERGLVLEIDGEQPVEVVREQLEAVVHPHSGGRAASPSDLLGSPAA